MNNKGTHKGVRTACGFGSRALLPKMVSFSSKVGVEGE